MKQEKSLLIEKLKAGTYRFYGMEGPEGYRVNRQPVMVEIKHNSYKIMVDKLGKEYTMQSVSTIMM